VGRGSRRGAVVLVVFAVGAVAPQFGAAQQIYKWTDSQGQVHYSDHAESGQKTTTVAVPQAPPASSQAATYGTPNTPPGPAGIMPQFVRNQQAENQYRAQRAAAAKQPAADEALVAKCKADRDTYCNNMSEIKRQQQLGNEPQPVRTRCENNYDAYGHSVGRRCWEQMPPATPSPAKPPPPAYSRFGVPTKKPQKSPHDDN
jgi:hypothetical protein